MVLVYWALGQHGVLVMISRSLCFVLLASFHHWLCDPPSADNHGTNCGDCNHAVYLHIPSHAKAGVWCYHRCYGSGWSVCSRKGNRRTNRQLEAMVSMASGINLRCGWHHLLTCLTIRAFLLEDGTLNWPTFWCPLVVWLWHALVSIVLKYRHMVLTLIQGCGGLEYPLKKSLASLAPPPPLVARALYNYL